MIQREMSSIKIQDGEGNKIHGDMEELPCRSKALKYRDLAVILYQ